MAQHLRLSRYIALPHKLSKQPAMAIQSPMEEEFPYIQAFPEPRGKFQISTGGGQYPQWGPGGRELFYVSLDSKLVAVSLKLGADSIEPSTPRELFPLSIVDSGWSPYDTA